MSLPTWAAAMADLHTHASPSLLPRHGDDRATVAAEQALGFTTVVLKAHEGSTVERAAAAGGADAGVYGGVVLNSPVGGANPDAVEVAARLGGRAVWMPTGDEQQVVQLWIDLVDRQVHVLEEVPVLSCDRLLGGRRDIDRDAFLHQAKVRDEELEVLELVGCENDRPRERVRRLESRLVKFHVSLSSVTS